MKRKQEKSVTVAEYRTLKLHCVLKQRQSRSVDLSNVLVHTMGELQQKHKSAETTFPWSHFFVFFQTHQPTNKLLTLLIHVHLDFDTKYE
jgi:hypothetical protein